MPETSGWFTFVLASCVLTEGGNQYVSSGGSIGNRVLPAHALIRNLETKVTMGVPVKATIVFENVNRAADTVALLQLAGNGMHYGDLRNIPIIRR